MTLGGTSIRAIDLIARGESTIGHTVAVETLLGNRPFADVVADAKAVPLRQREVTDEPSGLRELNAGQRGILMTESLYGGTAFHLLFSADIRGPLDADRLIAVISATVRRHEGLRTLFVHSGSGLSRRVLDSFEPPVIRLRAPGWPDGVHQIHEQLSRTSAVYLRPFESPPLVFFLSGAGDRHALTLLIHHALVDGWSIGLLFREVFAHYAGTPLAPVSSPEAILAIEGERSVRAKVTAVTQRVEGVPAIEIPADTEPDDADDAAGAILDIRLDASVRRAVQGLAVRCGVTRNAVLAAAWSITLARWSGQREFLLGLAVAARRPTTIGAIGMATKLTPLRLRCEGSVVDFVQGTAAAMRQGMADADVPFEWVAAQAGAAGHNRNPLVQFAYAAHDDLVPADLAAADLRVCLHEGHCGGATFDATLAVREWSDDRCRLYIEYRTRRLSAATATGLAESLHAVLLAMTSEPDSPCESLDAVSDAQRETVLRWGAGRPVRREAGLWELIERSAAANPDACAVEDGKDRLSYADLLSAVAAESGVLASRGVRAGDHVVIDVRRSARQVIAVLAVLRLGAVNVAIEPGSSPAFVAALLDEIDPVTIITDDCDGPLARVAEGRDVMPTGIAVDETVAAAEPDPERAVYISFTSGSTGKPKGVVVPERAVVRLVLGADYIEQRVSARYLRLAPLGFDASTLEIFLPLVRGGTIVVFPPGSPTAATLADFLKASDVRGLFLTTGLFRLLVDHRPDAFDEVVHVITGGEIVPPDHVAKVLRRGRGTLVSNAYGPTENTTFTTVAHFSDTAQVGARLPIGRPIAGGGVLLVNSAGRLVPPGALGELCAYGDGLAIGYLGDPKATNAAFGEYSPDLPQRLYRTGDVARWDSCGRLQFVGRRDQQIKVRGFRVDLDQVREALTSHTDVVDAAVIADLDGPDRRIVAALIPDTPGLIERVRAHAAGLLPAYAVPVLWTTLAQLPVNRNGKIDGAAILARLAADRTAPTAATATATAAEPTRSGDQADLEKIVAAAWAEVLGTDDFAFDEPFFDVGGDSLQLVQVRNSLREALPGTRCSVLDLFAHPTVEATAQFLRSEQNA